MSWITTYQQSDGNSWEIVWQEGNEYRYFYHGIHPTADYSIIWIVNRYPPRRFPHGPGYVPARLDFKMRRHEIAYPSVEAMREAWERLLQNPTYILALEVLG